SFPQLRNPGPAGAPPLDAVPTSAGAFNGDFVLALLSGQPFPAGVPGVRRVKPETGTIRPCFSRLRRLHDLVPDARSPHALFVLQYWQDPATGAPGRVLWFDSPLSSPITITDRVVTPTSMAIDPRTGDLLVTEISTGRIVSMPIPR